MYNQENFKILTSWKKKKLEYIHKNVTQNNGGFSANLLS